jgi:hypothetical protein
MEQCPCVFKCDIWYQNKFLGLIGKSSKAFGECKNDPRQMASNECVTNTMVVVELKAKKKYKIKMKEKDVVVENLITLG